MHLRARVQNSSRSLIFAASFGGARIGFNSSRGLVATVFVFTVNAQVPFGSSFPFRHCVNLQVSGVQLSSTRRHHPVFSLTLKCP